jgi:hypothetical protein
MVGRRGKPHYELSLREAQRRSNLQRGYALMMGIASALRFSQ